MSPLNLRDLMSYVGQGLLLLVLLTALLRIERVLHSLDLAVTRLDYHFLLQRSSPDDSCTPTQLPAGDQP